ncbi:MAG: hypothetical protein HYV09_33170 [Deltaproteobacteria bacterium]|nr:hypothetical protein [Deltaproteobacteria bacterium]
MLERGVELAEGERLDLRVDDREGRDDLGCTWMIIWSRLSMAIVAPADIRSPDPEGSPLVVAFTRRLARDARARRIERAAEPAS